jgi:hypothetical protein
MELFTPIAHDDPWAEEQDNPEQCAWPWVSEEFSGHSQWQWPCSIKHLQPCVIEWYQGHSVGKQCPESTATGIN